ncbi:hypothetical protein AB0D22_07775 [Kitasatospora sp. NPDC048538]|uniref:hypothetical protein n=1 Tax=Kitasatospora sp. NPDC048538 TaxID=3155633 RepID=UPI003409BEA6
MEWLPENEQRIAELDRLAAEYAATHEARPSSAQPAWYLPSSRSTAAGWTPPRPPFSRPASAESAYWSGAAGRARGR